MADIKIAFIYRPRNPYLCGRRYQNNFRKWFFEALPHAEGLDVRYYGAENELDLRRLGPHDVYLFFDAVEWGIPRSVIGIDDVKGLKVCHIGDCHGADKPSEAYGGTKLENCRRFGFNAYFFQHSSNYFRRYFPPEFIYWWVPLGVDPVLYRRVRYYNARSRDRVLLTGCLGKEYYPLRTMLKDMATIIDHRHPGSYSKNNYSPGEWDGEKYKDLLEQFAASVASGYSVVNKYFEVPAAGCLTFAHVDADNDCECIGFVDGETAVLIDAATAEAKIKEYLATATDPKWEQIAAAGRRYVLDNYTHAHNVACLVTHIREALGG